METLACGCPGSAARALDKTPTTDSGCGESRPSELRTWPVQLTLVPETAPWFQGADLLIAADCGPFAYADFHRDFLKGKIVVNACPKLDQAGPYVEKLARIFAKNDLRSITVAILEVPCCRGLDVIVKEALKASGKQIPLELAVIGTNGERRQ
ncbi:MAG: iron-sulfur cluster-binding oxidoreductase [Deferrisomatales bacterium]